MTSWSIPMNHQIYDGNFLSFAYRAMIFRYKIFWEGAQHFQVISVSPFLPSRSRWSLLNEFHSLNLSFRTELNIIIFVVIKRHRPHLVSFRYLLSRNVLKTDLTISTFVRKISSFFARSSLSFKLNLFWWFTDDGNHHFFNILSSFQHSTKKCTTILWPLLTW